MYIALIQPNDAKIAGYVKYVDLLYHNICSDMKVSKEEALFPFHGKARLIGCAKFAKAGIDYRTFFSISL